MKDEIKEIIKNIIYRLDCKSPTAYDGIELSKEESNLLLDYITNLQKENNKQKEVLDKIKEYIKEEEYQEEGYGTLVIETKKLNELLEEIK